MLFASKDFWKTNKTDNKKDLHTNDKQKEIEFKTLKTDKSAFFL